MPRRLDDDVGPRRDDLATIDAAPDTVTVAGSTTVRRASRPSGTGPWSTLTGTVWSVERVELDLAKPGS